MDYSKMFDIVPSKPPKENEFVDFFANVKPTKKQEEYKDIFASQQTVPKQDTKNLQLFNKSQEEQEVESFDHNLSYHYFVEWTKKWDVKFDSVSKGNQELSSKMLDLNQDIARHDTKQEGLFNEIVKLTGGINDRLLPKEETRFGIFKRVVEPEPITDKELHTFVDNVQDRLMNIKPEIDPFVNKVLESLSERCETLLRDADQGMLSLSFLIKKNSDDDTINRRIERLEKVRKLIMISKLAIETTRKSIIERHEQLQDFKGIVVPTMLHKLSMFLQNGVDKNSMSTALESLINIKLKG